MRDLTTEEILKIVPDVIDATTVKLRPYNRVKPWLRRRGNAKKKWWSADDRIKAATTYAIVGSAVETERITGISQNTIRVWKTQDWWPQIIERIRLEADDELDVKFTKVVDKAVALVTDRMDKGDFIYDIGRGTMVRKPVSMKDGASVASAFLDKRQLLRQKKDARMEEASVTERLKKLADEFEKFTKSKTVEGEVVTEEPTTVEILNDARDVSLHDVPVVRSTSHVDQSVHKNTPTRKIMDYVNQAKMIKGGDPNLPPCTS